MIVSQNNLIISNASAQEVENNLVSQCAEISCGAVKEHSVKQLILSGKGDLGKIVGVLVIVVAVAIIVAAIAKSLLVGFVAAGIGFLALGLYAAYRSWSECKVDQVNMQTAVVKDLDGVSSKVSDVSLVAATVTQNTLELVRMKAKKVVVSLKELQEAKRQLSPCLAPKELKEIERLERRLLAAKTQVREDSTQLRSVVILDILSRGETFTMRAIKQEIRRGFEKKISYGVDLLGDPLRFNLLKLILKGCEARINGVGIDGIGSGIICNEKIFIKAILGRFSANLDTIGIAKSLVELNENLKNCGSFSEAVKVAVSKKYNGLIQSLCRIAATDIFKSENFAELSEEQINNQIIGIVTDLYNFMDLNEKSKGLFVVNTLKEIVILKQAAANKAKSANEAKAKALLIPKYEIREKILTDILDNLQNLRMGYLYVKHGVRSQTIVGASLLFAAGDSSVETEVDKLREASQLNFEAGGAFLLKGIALQDKAHAQLENLWMNIVVNKTEIVELENGLEIKEEFQRRSVELQAQVNVAIESLKELAEYKRTGSTLTALAVCGFGDDGVVSFGDFDQKEPLRLINRDQLSEEFPLDPTLLPVKAI
jgi:hypothetical protein